MFGGRREFAELLDGLVHVALLQEGLRHADAGRITVRGGRGGLLGRSIASGGQEKAPEQYGEGEVAEHVQKIVAGAPRTQASLLTPAPEPLP